MQPYLVQGRTTPAINPFLVRNRQESTIREILVQQPMLEDWNAIPPLLLTEPREELPIIRGSRKPCGRAQWVERQSLIGEFVELREVIDVSCFPKAKKNAEDRGIILNYHICINWWLIGTKDPREDF